MAEFGLLGGGNNDMTRRTSPPQSINIVRGANTWTQVSVANYGVLAPAPGTFDGTKVYFRSDRDPGNAIANLEYAQGKDGVCILPASGRWWVNCQTNIAAGTSQMMLYDILDPAALMPFAEFILASNPAVRTMSAPATATVTGATTQIIAANVNRNFLAITHTGTTNGTTATGSLLYLSFNGSAVVGSGIMLAPNQTLIFDSLDGVTTQVVNGISTSGNIDVGVQEGI